MKFLNNTKIAGITPCFLKKNSRWKSKLQTNQKSKTQINNSVRKFKCLIYGITESLLALFKK